MDAARDRRRQRRRWSAARRVAAGVACPPRLDGAHGGLGPRRPDARVGAAAQLDVDPALQRAGQRLEAVSRERGAAVCAARRPQGGPADVCRGEAGAARARVEPVAAELEGPAARRLQQRRFGRRRPHRFQRMGGAPHPRPPPPLGPPEERRPFPRALRPRRPQAAAAAARRLPRRRPAPRAALARPAGAHGMAPAALARVRRRRRRRRRRAPRRPPRRRAREGGGARALAHRRRGSGSAT